MKKVLINITTPFGYHTDSYMYCKYLDKQKYEVHYVCFDTGYMPKVMEQVQVHYISVHSNKVLRYLNYVTEINRLIKKQDFDLIFLINSQAALLIRLCNLFRKTVFDIRTGEVWMDKKQFSLFDLRVRLSALFFKRISIISMNLAEKIKIPAEKCHELPLGGEIIQAAKRTYESLNLLYIGVLSGRNVYQTVEAVALLKEQNPEIRIAYNIVGYGSHSEEKYLNETIESLSLSNEVKFHGRKSHDEIKDLFELSNVGVVYIPITYGYNCQPTTKLFECLLAGMPVIATNTLENAKIVDSDSGVLIKDNAQAFADGLIEIWQNRSRYNSDIIIEKYKSCSWNTIVKSNLEPYFDSILND